MKILLIAITVLAASGASGEVTLNIAKLGKALDKDGWYSKDRTKAVRFEMQGSNYRVWWPKLSTTPSDGLFISTKMDHDRRTWFQWKDDHAFVEMTYNHEGVLVGVSAKIVLSDGTTYKTRRNGYFTNDTEFIKKAAELAMKEGFKALSASDGGRGIFPAAVIHTVNTFHRYVSVVPEMPPPPKPKPKPKAFWKKVLRFR